MSSREPLRDRSRDVVFPASFRAPQAGLVFPPTSKDLEQVRHGFLSVKSQVLNALRKAAISEYLVLQASEPPLTDAANRQHRRKAFLEVFQIFNQVKTIDEFNALILSCYKKARLPERFKSLAEVTQRVAEGFTVHSEQPTSRFDSESTSYDFVVAAVDWCATLSEKDLRRIAKSFFKKCDAYAHFDAENERRRLEQVQVQARRFVPEAEVLLVKTDEGQIQSLSAMELPELQEQAVEQAKSEATDGKLKRQNILDKIKIPDCLIPLANRVEELRLFLAEYLAVPIESIAQVLRQVVKPIREKIQEGLSVVKSALENNRNRSEPRESIFSKYAGKFLARLKSSNGTNESDNLDDSPFGIRNVQSGVGSDSAVDQLEASCSIKAGSILSNDPDFFSRLHNSSVWIPVGGNGDLRLLDRFIAEVSATNQEDASALYEGLYLQIRVPQGEVFDRKKLLESDHTQIMAKISRSSVIQLPLAAGYELKSITFLDRKMRVIPAESHRVELCLLGSFQVECPKNARHITYVVCPSEEAKNLPVHILQKYLPKLQIFLPLEERALEQCLKEYYLNPTQRAKALLIYEFLAHDYIYTKDSYLTRLYRSVGGARLEAMNALKMGICDNLAWYFAARITHVGALGVVVTGPSLDKNTSQFSYQPGHSVTGIVDATGLTQFDVTDYAKSQGISFMENAFSDNLGIRDRWRMRMALRNPGITNQDVYRLCLDLRRVESLNRKEFPLSTEIEDRARDYFRVRDKSENLQAYLLGNNSPLSDWYGYTEEEDFEAISCLIPFAMAQQRMIARWLSEPEMLGRDNCLITGIPFTPFATRFVFDSNDFPEGVNVPEDLRGKTSSTLLFEYASAELSRRFADVGTLALAQEWVLDNFKSLTESEVLLLLKTQDLQSLSDSQLSRSIEAIEKFLISKISLTTEDNGTQGLGYSGVATIALESIKTIRHCQLEIALRAISICNQKGISSDDVLRSISNSLMLTYTFEVSNATTAEAKSLASQIEADLLILDSYMDAPQGASLLLQVQRGSNYGFPCANYILKHCGPEVFRCPSVANVVRYLALERTPTVYGWNLVRDFVETWQAASAVTGASVSMIPDLAAVLQKDQARLSKAYGNRVEKVLNASQPQYNWPGPEYPASSIAVRLMPDIIRLSLRAMVDFGIITNEFVIASSPKYDEAVIAQDLLKEFSFTNHTRGASVRRLSLGRTSSVHLQPLDTSCSEIFRVCYKEEDGVVHAINLSEAFSPVDSELNSNFAAFFKLVDPLELVDSSLNCACLVPDLARRVAVRRLLDGLSSVQVYEGLLWASIHADELGFDCVRRSWHSCGFAEKVFDGASGTVDRKYLSERFLQLNVIEDSASSHLKTLDWDIKLRVATAASISDWSVSNMSRSGALIAEAMGWKDGVPHIIKATFAGRSGQFNSRVLWRSALGDSASVSEIEEIYEKVKGAVDNYAHRSGVKFNAPFCKYLLSQGAPIRSLAQSGDFHELHAHVPGERINWRASAKQDRLVSSSFKENEIRNTTLLLDVEWFFDTDSCGGEPVLKINTTHVREMFVHILLAARERAPLDLLFLFRGNSWHFDRVDRMPQDDRDEYSFFSSLYSLFNAAQQCLDDEIKIYPEGKIPGYRQTAISEINLKRESLMIVGIARDNLVASGDLLVHRRQRGAFVHLIKT